MGRSQPFSAAASPFRPAVAYTARPSAGPAKRLRMGPPLAGLAEEGPVARHAGAEVPAVRDDDAVREVVGRVAPRVDDVEAPVGTDVALEEVAERAAERLA